MRMQSGFGEIQSGMRFDTFEVEEFSRPAFEAAMEMTERIGRWWNRREVEGEKVGLVLYGIPGVGKTHLACAIVNRVADSIRRLFCRFQPMVTFPRDDQDALEQMSDPDYVPVLVLDDFGMEKQTERSVECAFCLVDGRLRNRGPLIVTTNYLPETLQEIYGERGAKIVGRLREACDWIPVGGSDHRERM